MKTTPRIVAALVLGALLAGNAWADRPWHPPPPHAHTSVEFGVYVGGPWVYPPYYPYPSYWPRVYVPPVAPVVVVPPPPVYVEQQTAAVPVLEPGYWYYCNEAKAYYPYVKDCPGSWQKVAPQPNR